MKGFIIHSEIVRKRNGKIQFQIKLPTTIKKITGVRSVIDTRNTFRNVRGFVALDQFKGSVSLWIPQARDVFFAGEVLESNGKVSGIFRKPEFGFVHSDAFWISGRRPELLSVEVPVNNTLIEGYYEDASSDQMQGYTLRIYLETEL